MGLGYSSYQDSNLIELYTTTCETCGEQFEFEYYGLVPCDCPKCEEFYENQNKE